MEIRDARAEEIDEIAALLAAAWKEYIPENPDESWRRYLQDIADVRGRWADSVQIVAADGPRIAGAVTFYPDAGAIGDPDDRWPDGWSSIRLLGVLPSERGRGIGRLLARECIDRARRRGSKVVGLHTADMMKVAMSMYERMGFVRYSEKDFHPNEDVTIKAYRLDL